MCIRDSEESDQSGSCGASRTKGKLVREVEPFGWLMQGWVDVGPDYKSFHNSGHNRSDWLCPNRLEAGISQDWKMVYYDNVNHLQRFINML